jgi:hypothetical protein
MDDSGETQPGTLGYGVLSDPLNKPTRLIAYHNDLVGGFDQYESADAVRRVFTTGQFNHYTDATQQSSGGPVMSSGDWAQRVFALNTGEYDDGTVRYNIGTLITSEANSAIRTWSTQAW